MSRPPAPIHQNKTWASRDHAHHNPLTRPCALTCDHHPPPPPPSPATTGSPGESKQNSSCLAGGHFAHQGPLAGDNH
ncbi:hypothetical protein Pcinc_001840 [Petrolisthes cinctipes]|uniref:Uncharacterized protein n=1 Tax=Petrolisthes cinctipes TaxID=88211 RepID=A0AAE1GMI1_PETCI|nr:hypothetical protein Pcinc_001840 [Petrolisthes cinctipes]